MLTNLSQRDKPRHVDRSIGDPDEFIETNVLGTLKLLKVCFAYWRKLPLNQQSQFRFINISTDEVYGSLTAAGAPFSEITPYAPNSPYAASKASADHLVRAFHSTHGLPTITTNCSNNYGPYQFPEKLIPLAIQNAITEQHIPIYGDGLNVRDWLHVSDHCKAIKLVLAHGLPGEKYNFGGANERANLEIVELVCHLLDQELPLRNGRSYKEQIRFVPDRPSVQLFRGLAELHNEIAGKVLRFDLPALFPPQAEQGAFILPHDGSGVRATNE